MQNNRWLQALIVLLVIIASAWIIAQIWGILLQFSNILLLFFLSWLLAFILRPIAKWLHGRGMPYGLAVAVVYLLLAGVFTVGGFMLVEPVKQQVANITDLINTQLGPYTDPAHYPNGSELSRTLDELNKNLGLTGQDWTNFLQQSAGQVQGIASNILSSTLSIANGVAQFVLQLILILIFSFYFMKDGDRIFATVLKLLPPRWEDEVRLVGSSIGRSFGGFVRGQLLFAIAYAVANAIVMVIPPFSLTNYALIASILAGLFMIIPLIGNLLAYAPPMLFILLDPNKNGQWWVLLIALLVMQTIMMNVLGPRIMSSAIGLHPLYVMGSMLLGLQVAGVWGALFGVPVAGAINLIGRPLMRRVRYQTELYREVPGSRMSTSQFMTGALGEQLLEEIEAGEPISRPRGPVESAPAASTSGALPAATASVSAGNVAGQLPTRPAPVSDLDYFEDDMPARPSPTLSGRLWRLVFAVLSRARSWAWGKVQDRRASGSRSARARGRGTGAGEQDTPVTDRSVKRET